MPAKDRRYKVTPDIIIRMRQMRAQGVSYQRIGDAFNLSYSTALYWTNKEQREKQRAKTKLRTHSQVETKSRVARDAAKRKENWAVDPDMELRHSIQSANDEKRAKRKTVRGMKMKDANKLLQSGTLKRRNSKMED